MKFVNATLTNRRCHGDKSECPYGRKADISPPPPAPIPKAMLPRERVEEVLKSLKVESKQFLESKMLKASRNLPVSAIQKETEDILAILRDIHNKK